MPIGRTRSKRVFYGGGYLGQKLYAPYTQYYFPSNTTIWTCIDEVHAGPPYLSGGPLAIQKDWINYGITGPVYTKYTSLPQNGYEGKFYVPAYWTSIPAESSLSGWGARGWARTSPVKPIYQFGVSLAELRDVPRMLKQTQSFLKKFRFLQLHKDRRVTFGQFLKDLSEGGIRGLGSDYLNLQFGWVPMLRDLGNTLLAKDTVTKRIAQLKRDNGKPIRRSTELLRQRSSTIIFKGDQVGSTLSPGSLTIYNLVGGPQPYMTWRVYSRRIWYSAEYTFWIPELHVPIPHEQDLKNLRMRLLGLRLNPDLIYRSLPWTWLLDWFTNVGDVVSNASNNQPYHMVAKYAYVMAEESWTWHTSGTHDVKVGTYGSGSTPPTMRQYAMTSNGRVWKRRVEANPYGFGVSDGMLSAYQWSILVALGLTRFR